MKRMVMMVAVVMAACFGAALAFAADESNDKQVNPKVKKLVEKLTANVETLTAKLPADITDEDKTKLMEEFDLLKRFVKTHLIPLCVNKTFAQQVAGQNAKQISLDEIQKIDKQWKEAEDELPVQAEKMGNDCAKEIAKIIKKFPVLGETFVMDNQGANVGQNALTSDYWQGDEAKWKNSYKNAKGGIDVSGRKLDKSTNVVDQKVSLPIIDAQGKVIGAVCFGVKTEMLTQVMVAANSSN
jgi:hypothetical protein